MFTIKNVPIVIEPGVRALESEIAVNDHVAGFRTVPVQLTRVPLEETSAEKLPFIPTTRTPHVFSVSANLDTSLALVLYDSLGRISTLYTRNKPDTSWERFDIAEEHAGKSITQFSVRFVFASQKDRSKFLTAMEKIVDQAGREIKPNIEDVMAALRPLARSRVAPVVIPVAVEKCSLGKIKL
ncbi:hypothetical protein EBZ39_04535 [bacterium]|nr:hypothetical protein [bacterium]